MSSLEGSASASFTNEARSTDSLVPPSIPMVREVPERPDPEIFWSSVPELFKELRSTVWVPPASVISRLVPLSVAEEMSSFVESLSSSPVLDIKPLLISIPNPALYVDVGKVIESPVILSDNVLPSIDKFCNSLVASPSTSENVLPIM